MGDITDNALLEQCLQVANMYQRKFPSVRMLSSKEFVEHWSNNDDFLLLDARTAVERSICKIRNSIPISEYNDTNQKQKIVVYCTIGYRSGLEATRLQQLFPHRIVYNLDGLMAYSHYNHTNNNIVNADNEPTRVIHTFASNWDYVNHDVYETTHFPNVSLPVRFLQVGVKIIIRRSQTLWFKLSQCLCSKHQ